MKLTRLFLLYTAVFLSTLLLMVACLVQKSENGDEENQPIYVGTWICELDDALPYSRETLVLTEDTFEYMKALNFGTGYTDYEGARGRGTVTTLTDEFAVSFQFLDEIYGSDTLKGIPAGWYEKGGTLYDDKVLFPVAPQVFTVSGDTLTINWGIGERVFVRYVGPVYAGTWVCELDDALPYSRETLVLTEDTFEYMKALDFGSGYTDLEGARGRGTVVKLTGSFSVSFQFLDEIYGSDDLKAIPAGWYEEGDTLYDDKVLFPVAPQVFTVSNNTLTINWGKGQRVFIKQ